LKTAIITHKVLIKPTRSQVRRIDQWIGTCRFVYNLAKEVKENAYKSYGVSVSKFDMIKQLPDLKKDHVWLQDVDSQAMQAVIERLYLAYDKFYSGSGYPKWAKKNEYNSFLLKKGRFIDAHSIQVPKLGVLKFKATRFIDILEKVRTVTIKKENGHYFACIVMDHEPIRYKAKNEAIGIDLGVTHLISTSTGEYIDCAIRYKDYSNRLSLLQRKLARQKRFGKNWLKTKKEIIKLHSKISNVRLDHLHKVSTRIVNENQVIVLENLKIRNMSRSAKGTLESPGKNVKAKSGLNRSILNSGMGMLRSMLIYKGNWQNREVILVDPKYTSQTCFSCGSVDLKSRNKESFVCTSCGHEAHADTNAAKNILEKGILHRRERKAVA
jgi:putative transposase